MADAQDVVAIQHDWAIKNPCLVCGNPMPLIEIRKKGAPEGAEPLAVYWLCRNCDKRYTTFEHKLA